MVHAAPAAVPLPAKLCSQTLQGLADAPLGSRVDHVNLVHHDIFILRQQVHSQRDHLRLRAQRGDEGLAMQG